MRFSLLGLLIATTTAVAQPPRAQRISLDDALRTAAKVSYALAAASAGVDAARANVTAARSGYFPQVTVTASYLNTIESEYDALFASSNTSNMLGTGFEALPFGQAHTWRAGIDAQQLIWDGGKTGAGIAGAKANLRIIELDERSRRAVVVLAVADAYASAVLADKLVGIGESSLQLAEKTLEQAKLGFDQGSTAEFDVVRAEVTRDTQRTAVLRARAARDLATLRIKRLLQLPLDRPIELTTDLAGDVAPLAAGVAGVAAQKEAFSVARARETVAARAAEVKSASSSWHPQVSAFTSYGLVDYPRTLRPDDEWRTNWTAGVNVTLPLFTGFRRKATIDAAKANRRASEAQLADASAQAELDLRTAKTNVDVAVATLQSNARSVDLARRAYQIAEVRYQQGVSTYLELTDARIALDRALGDQASAAKDLQVARVRLALFPALPPTQGTP